MTEFFVTQVLSLNGLVNLSNIIFLVAFSVHDVLRLRALSVVSYLVILPYYYFQQATLWPPIFWGVAFIIINGVRIAVLILERRPVVLSKEEDELHRLAFRSLGKREFLRLVNLAEWIDCSPGTILIAKGQHVSDVMIMVSGEVEAILNDATRVKFQPGQLIGSAVAFSGLASPVEVVVRRPARLAKWKLEHVREFTEARPELRAKLLQITSVDLVTKVQQLAGVGSKSP